MLEKLDRVKRGYITLIFHFFYYDTEKKKRVQMQKIRIKQLTHIKLVKKKMAKAIVYSNLPSLIDRSIFQTYFLIGGHHSHLL